MKYIIVILFAWAFPFICAGQFKNTAKNMGLNGRPKFLISKEYEISDNIEHKPITGHHYHFNKKGDMISHTDLLKEISTEYIYEGSKIITLTSDASHLETPDTTVIRKVSHDVYITERWDSFWNKAKIVRITEIADKHTYIETIFDDNQDTVAVVTYIMDRHERLSSVNIDSKGYVVSREYHYGKNNFPEELIIKSTDGSTGTISYDYSPLDKAGNWTERKGKIIAEGKTTPEPETILHVREITYY